MKAPGSFVRAVIVVITGCFLIMTSATRSYSQTPPAEIAAAARTGLHAILAATQQGGGAARLGFTAQDIYTADIRDAFPIFTIPPQALLNAVSVRDLRSIAVQTTQWEFVVVSSGVPKAMLTVDRTEEGWKAVSLGAAGLAEQVQELSEAWAVDAGYQRMLIRIYQANAEFLEIWRNGLALGAVPLGSGRVAIGAGGAFNARDLRTARDVVEMLKPVVTRHLQAGR